jgi:serine/threonine-protein kinase
VLDDPDLTADLAPTVPVRADDDVDYTRDDVPAILTPAEVAAGAADHRDEDAHHTSVIGRTGALPQARPSRPEPRPVTGPRRSRRGPLLLALVLTLAILAGLGGWWFGAGRYVTTPGVVNLSVEKARAKVHAAGLGFTVGKRAYSETVVAGSVISTDPAGGEKILHNGTVSAVVSRGPERYRVPSLRGLSVDAAQRAVDKEHLTWGDVTERYDARVEAGKVLSSTPKAGTEVKPRTPVDVVVSKGPKPIPVPDFTGKDAREAVRTLRGLGLKVDLTRDNSDTVPKGAVISQSPRTGTLFRGDTVGLDVSKGPVLVQVPDVTRMGTADATRTLQAAGFQVRTEQSSLYVGLEYVVGQNPSGGSMAPQGSVVTLSLV